MGLVLEVEPPEALLIWPENWLPLQVFVAMATQWRTGVAGATGLDYAVLPLVMRWQGVPRADQPEVFDAVRVMESEALRLLAEK
jgi:hypothetical protein